MSYRSESVFSRTLTTAFAVIFFCVLANVSQAGVTIVDGRITQITDIVIYDNGTAVSNYTADIIYGVSYLDAFTSQPTFFGDEDSADQAADDMFAQGKAALVDDFGSTYGTQFTNVVYATVFDEDQEETVWHSRTVRQDTEVDGVGFAAAGLTFSQVNVGFAKFTLTGVPEPTSLVLFGGLSALGMVGRRRRRS